ncbi:unnamed protein product [Nippostrongylus brasiliensis]|uniref:T-complex protein 1 subunit theta n=1 Tax=Nippostrongylus brasiliensis TaxID=27835 RepID=A0A0N4YT09_NIPBR|nr:unnamed protein product [Nippostrongylus brasiliensis]
MAMNIPKSGYNRFMKEGAQHFKGTDEAVLRNIDACVELASQLRSAYGPNGMNKMVINHIEKLFVTNDAATILKELEIQHPAAKIIIMASQMQEKQGLTPQEVAAGYEKAAEKALEILPSLVLKEATDLRDIAMVKKFLRSAITSKQYDNEETIADLVAKACVLTVPKNSFNFNVDNIRICKILGSGVNTSMVMNGMVFKRGAEGEVKSVQNAFTCPFDLTQTETKGTVLIENAEELMSFSKGEESEVESQVKALADAGVQVVVAAGKFGDLYLHFLNKYKIMGVRLTSKFDLRRLCRTVGAQAQARICAPAVNLLGTCDSVHVKEIGEENVVVFDNKCAPAVNLLGTCDSVHVKEIGEENVVVFDNKGERGNVATVIIRGSSQSRIDDVERAVDDAVNTYKALTKDGRLLAGAGAVEIELARQIESFGEKCAGLEQYAIKKFAYALETLPKSLAENAGMNATDILTKLNAAHEAGQQNAGIDIWKHEIMDAGENCIFDLYAGKKLAIKLATDAAATILKVDQIIIAKQASGGPKPRGPKPQDEDDDGMA